MVTALGQLSSDLCLLEYKTSSIDWLDLETKVAFIWCFVNYKPTTCITKSLVTTIVTLTERKFPSCQFTKTANLIQFEEMWRNFLLLFLESAHQDRKRMFFLIYRWLVQALTMLCRLASSKMDTSSSLLDFVFLLSRFT